MQFNAMKIDHLKSLAGHDWEAFAAGEKTAPLIIRLAEILDELEPQGDDDLHVIWAKCRRPTFRQFYDGEYGAAIPYHEAKTNVLEASRKDYEDCYPYPKVWYQIGVKHFTRKPGEEFYAFFVDHQYIFSINDLQDAGAYEAEDLLDWAISEAKTFVDEVRKGTCEANILERIPYCYRNGEIKRSDLWEAYPQFKKDFFKNYKKREIKKFIRYFKTDQKQNTLLPNMTARVFYEACAVVYKSIKRQRKTASYYYTESDAEREHYNGTEQTPKEMYYSLADGRDNGLKNVPMDDPAAFEEWKANKGPYYEFNGSHPWEIIPSFSISFSMHLYPQKKADGGWYFALSGESEPRSPETIIAANALYEAGYPVEVIKADKIIDRLEGSDHIEVVPLQEAVFIGESIHLKEKDIGVTIAKKTVWKFDRYELKDKSI